ncbi:GNAT family N-acetyltransferase [Pseudoduganella violaceinigra]|uniref:GNAT family N-acetyltransferase n=1 Tax=Pseudoduganella violaceinigra TaxID=246602 RepID=UPI00048163A9|nr:GNAT family N-acetyltransferase [Pseudoduganella violaceinigra]
MNTLPPNQSTTTFTSSAAAFGVIHCGTDPRVFADNLRTEVALLMVDGRSLPVTVNDGEKGNAWVCSPLTTYCDYALEELHRNVHPIIGAPLGLVCRAYGRVLERAVIDRAVTLNNWLLSTNLYPPLDSPWLENLVQNARERWPQHALWFRSLNSILNQDWIAALAAQGFQMVPSRQVYLFDDLPSKVKRHQGLKRDLMLLSKTSMKRTDGSDFTQADYLRIQTLYRRLYLEKYSMLNPRYTARFIERWHAAGLLRFHGFRDNAGELQAVVGIFAQDGMLTAPIVGYETALPQSLGMYRLLMACVFEQAMATGSNINLSAGAAHFKRLRGGTPAIEYSAVLVSHMPKSTRRAVGVLSALTNKIGVPLMRRFKL